MAVLLNFIILGKTSFEESCTVNIGKTNRIDDNVDIPIKDLRIPHLKKLILKEAGRLCDIEDPNSLKLWKVNINESEKTKLDGVSTEEDIKNKLQGTLMQNTNFRKMFPKNPSSEDADNIHIIVFSPTETVKTVRDAINIVLKNTLRIEKEHTEPDDNMPFMDRDTNNAIARIIRNIENHLKGSKSKTDFDILVSGGVPGIGKTRYGDELFKHLENNQNWVPSDWKNNLHIESLYLDFGNGCQLDSYDDELTPTVIIGLQIAYVFFIERKYNMKFETFRDRVWKYRHIFKVPNVFDCIFEHLILQSDQHLFVFLHIDEFQLVDQWESDAVRERKMVKKELFKKMVNGLALFMLNPPPSHIFIQTFLSGTTPQVVISAKESSRVSFGFVNCPQLLLRAMLNIANHYAQKFNAEKFDCGTYRWLLCQPFLQLLEDTGGLPRALQYVFEECFEIGGGRKNFFDTIKKQNFNTIFDNIKNNIQVRYNMYNTIKKNKKLALELLHCSIDAIPVDRETCLDETDQNCTIENLERDTHIILNPYNGSTTKFTIMMPFLFICIYNDILQIVDYNLTKTFRVQKTMHWQDWELFVAYYEAFCTNLLIKRRKHTVRLGELFRGVYGTESAKNLEVRLKKLSVRLAKEQFPCSKLTDKESAKSINWEEGEDVIVNGMSAKWGDSFRVLETVQGDRFFSIHQAKYGYNSATYTLKNLHDEHIKNCESSFNTKNRLFDKLASYHHITIVFTTQPVYETVPYDDCFIISCGNFEQYFGPVFSSRATFALTKDINPNFSDLQRMVECLPGVGDVTAEKIIINRPYKSEDDFFKKHNRAKQGKEEHERENPEKKHKLDFYPFNV